MIPVKRDGKNMQMDVYKDVLEFIKKMGSPFVLLSGGEPTLHPDIERMVKISKENYHLHTYLLSNGTFLTDSKKEKILGLNVPIQITNDKRYYPVRIPIIKHENLLYTHKIFTINNCDNVIKNNIEVTRIAPTCFNLRSLVRVLGFEEAISKLRAMGKYCTPSVNFDGSVVAGEGGRCPEVGKVWNDIKVISKNIEELTCDNCKLISNLPYRFRQAIT
jgi:predicted  nucleic acid-binding Zn ribbon protein